MRRLRRETDGTTSLLGWTSRFGPVWFWHAMFDGTRVCHCRHSTACREVRRSREVRT